MEPKKEEFISGNTKKVLQKELAQLQRAVSIVAVLSDKQNRPFNDFCEKLLTELSSLTDKIRPVIVKPDSDIAIKYHVARTPTILIAPER